MILGRVLARVGSEWRGGVQACASEVASGAIRFGVGVRIRVRAWASEAPSGAASGIAIEMAPMRTWGSPVT